MQIFAGSQLSQVERLALNQSIFSGYNVVGPNPTEPANYTGSYNTTGHYKAKDIASKGEPNQVMAIRLTTTLNKISSIPNSENSMIIRDLIIIPLRLKYQKGFLI